MREAGPGLWSWLKQGAHFYVCGDAKRMAKDVERALVEIAGKAGSMSEAGARASSPSSRRPAATRRTSTDGGTPVRTTCPYCGVGCGVLASPDGGGGDDRGRAPEHPSNFGRLCSKGSALGETLGLGTRLLHPEVGGRRASWDAALVHVAAELSRIRAAHGPAPSPSTSRASS